MVYASTRYQYERGAYDALLIDSEIDAGGSFQLRSHTVPWTGNASTFNNTNARRFNTKQRGSEVQ